MLVPYPEDGKEAKDQRLPSALQRASVSIKVMWSSNPDYIYFILMCFNYYYVDTSVSGAFKNFNPTE